jgi:hypothetical protein
MCWSKKMPKPEGLDSTTYFSGSHSGEWEREKGDEFPTLVKGG